MTCSCTSSSWSWLRIGHSVRLSWCRSCSLALHVLLSIKRLLETGLETELANELLGNKMAGMERVPQAPTPSVNVSRRASRCFGNPIQCHLQPDAGWIKGLFIFPAMMLATWLSYFFVRCTSWWCALAGGVTGARCDHIGSYGSCRVRLFCCMSTTHLHHNVDYLNPYHTY